MLTTLLNWSDAVFVAQERYAPLVRRDPDVLLPSLFQTSRLNDFRPGECGYGSFASKPEYWYRAANRKNFEALGDYPVIGDKITHLFRRFERLETPAWHGEDVTVVHVIRNVHGVVASYLARKENKSDNWNLGADDAVADWRDAMEYAHAYHQDQARKAKMLIMDYDALRGSDEEQFVRHARLLFERLGLEFVAKQDDGIRRLFRFSGAIPRKPPLSPEMRLRIDQAIPQATLAKYEDLQRWSIGA